MTGIQKSTGDVLFVTLNKDFPVLKWSIFRETYFASVVVCACGSIGHLSSVTVIIVLMVLHAPVLVLCLIFFIYPLTGRRAKGSWGTLCAKL